MHFISFEFKICNFIPEIYEFQKLDHKNLKKDLCVMYSVTMDDVW